MNSRVQVIFFSALLLGALALAFFVFAPFLYALILAAVFAIVFHPLHKRLAKSFGKYKGVGALVTVFIVLIVVLAPLVFFGAEVFQESGRLYAAFAAQKESLMQLPWLTSFKAFVAQYAPSFSFDINTYAQQFLLWVSQNVGSIFSSITQIIFNFFITMVALFFFLRDGEKIYAALLKFSPLSDQYDRKIFDTLASAVDSVVKGTLVVSVIQGLAAGFGFWLFGVPNAALWGSLTVIAALIPVVGTMMTTVPAMFYVLFAVGPFPALGLFLWSSFIVGTIDNVLRPKLIERKMHLHPFVIFLSVLGGIEFFGPIGFLLGPLVVSFLFVLFGIYSSLFPERGKDA